MIYNKELLESLSQRDNCIIDYDKIERIYCGAQIYFTCSCGQICSKRFQVMNLKGGGGYCKICTIKNAQEKSKRTCMQIYGTPHSLQAEQVKNKSIETNMKKYGKKYPSQTECVINKMKETNIARRGVPYTLQDKEVRKKGIETNMKKWGVDNVRKAPEIKQKIQQTLVEHYGENPLQNEIIRNKKKETNLKKRGVEYVSQCPKVKEKIKNTILSIFGVEHAMHNEEIKAKVQKTNMALYGYKSAMHNAEVAERHATRAYKMKEYEFPCGTIVHVQGYEPFLLNILVDSGYSYENIITRRTEVPEIWYENNGKKCRYYCDVYIPKINTIYEVKSTWTYKIGTDSIYLKKQACIDAGYSFELYVFDSKGNRVSDL